MQLKTIKSGDKKLWCSNRYKRSVARTLNNIISIRAVKCSTSCFGVIFMQLRYCFQCAFHTSLASGGGRASSARIVPKTFSSGRKFFFSPFSPERKFVVRAPLVANFPFYELTYFLMFHLGSHSARRRRKSMRRRVHDTQQELWAWVRGELLGAHQLGWEISRFEWKVITLCILLFLRLVCSVSLDSPSPTPACVGKKFHNFQMNSDIFFLLLCTRCLSP